MEKKFQIADNIACEEARLYNRGRYCPRRETGTHHFHKLLARFLNT